jgi:hypothetical protein
MNDGFIDAAGIGKRLAGRSAKTGRRFLEDCPLPVYLVHGRKYVKESDFLAWLESQRLDPPAPSAPSSLKTLLETISAKTLAARKAKACRSNKNDN